MMLISQLQQKRIKYLYDDEAMIDCKYFMSKMKDGD